MPAHFRHGVFAEPKTYPCLGALLRSGPGLAARYRRRGLCELRHQAHGRAGPKLLDDEKFTQDFLSICTPTFVTPDTRANAKLQAWILKGRPLFYFTDPHDSHLLDGLMQSWWNKTQSNPLGERYWSCVPYLLGEGQAMMYLGLSSFDGLSAFPAAAPDAARRLSARQHGPHAGCAGCRVRPYASVANRPLPDADRECRRALAGEAVSVRAGGARAIIPRQKFASAAQLAFCDNLLFNPWHCLAEHRPLGNQSRARRRMYHELSRFRQRMNNKPHIEPTGNEMFENQPVGAE